MKFKSLIPILVTLLMVNCNNSIEKNNNQEQNSSQILNSNSDKIDVLNVGTFHFGYTTDANKAEFNAKGEKEQQEVRHLNKLLAEFKPTIICVEIEPQFEDELNEGYQKYLKNHDELETNWNEISMVAFEIARMNNVERIHAIDDQEIWHNYLIGEEIINTIDSVTYMNYSRNTPNKFLKIVENKELSLVEKIRRLNSNEALDFLIISGADILAHVGTDGNFEGADEAAKFYQRNLRMYSNINRISMNKEDRILILSGGSHAAFFREFMSKSPKYNLVNISDYLGE